MKCPNCGAENETNFCGNCGKSLSEGQPEKKKSKKKWFIAAAALFLFIVFVSAISGGDGGNADNQQASNQEPTEVSTTDAGNNENQQQEEENDNFVSAGMYKVGADIPAGEYLIYPNGMSYFQVTKDSSGSLDSIITNDNFSGTRYITVSEGQYVELKNSKMLPAEEAEPQEPNGNEYPPGMYKVGKDIPPGEYKVVSEGGMAYLEVSKSSRGELNDIVTNSNFDGEKYITISEGQYLKLSGCKLIK